MNNKFLSSIIILLIIALLGVTAIAAFLFGQLQARPNQSIVSANVNTPLTSLVDTFTNPLNTNNTNTPSNQQPINPLTNHDTWISFSADPTSFEEGNLVVESASVPEVLVCNPAITTQACQPDEILIYYVDALTLIEPGSEKLSLKRSTDGGNTWGAAESVTITTKPYNGPAVDPSVVLLPDGKIRLYYFGPVITQGDPAAANGNHSFYSAISTDGLHFTQETGERLVLEKITDPDVTKWNDTWYMLYSSGQNSGLATSVDGLTFTDQGLLSPSFGGVPGLVATPEGLRAYGCQQGIMTALSTTGQVFEKNSSAVLQRTELVTCDPSVEHYKNEYVMVYKVAPPLTTQKQ